MSKTTEKKTTKKNRITYNTPIADVEKRYGFKTNLPPNTKTGEVLKKNGYHNVASILPR